MLRNVEVSITDRMGRPVSNLDVSAIALARSGQIDEVEAVETTDSAGVCYFDLDEPCYYRPMLSPMLKREIRVVVINFGGQGIRKHFVVDAEGFGTHTTFQAASTAATAAHEDAVIYINPGDYREFVLIDVPGDHNFYIVAEGAVSNWDGGEYNPTVTLRGPAAGSSDYIVGIQGTGNVSFLGVYIEGGSDIGIQVVSGSIDIELRNCKISTSAAYCIDAATDVHAIDCIFTSSISRALGGAIAHSFEHCYFNVKGLFKGDWGNLTLKDCILIGDAPAGEYWIEEDALVISHHLTIDNCMGSASGGAGFVKFGAASALSHGLLLRGNEMTVAAGTVWAQINGVEGGVITDNVIDGVSDSDGSTAVELNAGTGPIGISALVVAHNSIRNIQNGLVVNASATDGTCVIGPNAYSGVGTATTGVPDAENYQVDIADLFGGDAADLTYTPAVDADWDGSTDPGDADDALDQLAERAKDLEGLAHAQAHALDGGDHTGVGDYTSILGLASLTIADANFGLALSGSNPRITLDSGDYLEYNRAGNYLEYEGVDPEIFLTSTATGTGHFTGLRFNAQNQVHGAAHRQWTIRQLVFAESYALVINWDDTATTDGFHVQRNGVERFLVSVSGDYVAAGRMKVGAYTGPTSNYKLWVEGDFKAHDGNISFINDGNQLLMEMKSFGTAQGVAFSCFNARGTEAVPLSLLNTDRIGLFAFYACNSGDGFGTASATFEAQVDGAPGADLMPTQFIFDITKEGDAARTRAMQIRNTGRIELPVQGATAGILIGGDANLYRSAANVLKTDDSFCIGADLDHDGDNAGFYGTAPIAKQAGVAVTAAGIHAALVALGLIAA